MLISPRCAYAMHILIYKQVLEFLSLLKYICIWCLEISFIPWHYATVFVLNGRCSNVYYYYNIYRGPQGRIAYYANCDILSQ